MRSRSGEDRAAIITPTGLVAGMALTVLLAWAGTVFAWQADSDPAENAAGPVTDVPSPRGDVQSSDEDVAEASPTFDEIPWEVRPYRVLLSLAVEDHPALTAEFRRQFKEVLRARLDGVMEPFWQTEFEANDWLLPASGDALQRLSTDDLSQHFLSTQFDKVILLTVEHKQTLRLAGREWDRNSRSQGPVLDRQVIDRRRTAAVALDLVIDLFRPLARIDSTEDGVAELRARGGELMAPQSLPVMFQAGDLLSPYFRYLDREGEVRSIQRVPWTFLKVDGIKRSRLTASVETAFNAPLAGSRRRVELVAIRERPTYKTTRLRLSPRTNPDRPLVGFRVRVYDHLSTEEQPDPETVELMTDRAGVVEISRDPEHPLRRLVVHSGGAVLASLPFLPGVEREISMELPDDSPRLQAEGNLAIVQGELIDLVSRRTVMLARALSFARKDQWERADELMDEIDRQPSIASFKSRILAIRIPAVAEAERNGNRAAAQRIVQMCRKLEELVERYLDRDQVREVQAEILELKSLSERSSSSGGT